MKHLRLVVVLLSLCSVSRPCRAADDSTFLFNRFSVSASYGFATPTHFVKRYGPYTLTKVPNNHIAFGADRYFSRPHHSFSWFAGIRINIWTLTFLEDIPKTAANGFLFDQYNFNRTYIFHSAHLFAGIAAQRKFRGAWTIALSLAAGPDFHMRWNTDIYSSQKPDLSSSVTVRVLALSIGNKDRWVRLQGILHATARYSLRNGNSLAAGIVAGWGSGDFAREDLRARTGDCRRVGRCCFAAQRLCGFHFLVCVREVKPKRQPLKTPNT